MRPMLVVSASATLLLIASGAGWAGGRSRTKGAQNAPEVSKAKETPPAFNKTFQWEEKEVGPSKGIDHEKIAALQEQGRQEAARRREEEAAHPKKAVRPAGVNGPASAKLPTMAIEQAAPARSPIKKAAYVPPRQPDAIDNVLAENGVGPEPNTSGLDRIVGHSHKRKPKRHHRH
jgi:hypothetical protein